MEFEGDVVFLNISTGCHDVHECLSVPLCLTSSLHLDVRLSGTPVGFQRILQTPPRLSKPDGDDPRCQPPGYVAMQSRGDGFNAHTKFIICHCALASHKSRTDARMPSTSAGHHEGCTSIDEWASTPRAVHSEVEASLLQGAHAEDLLKGQSRCQRSS